MTAVAGGQETSGTGRLNSFHFTAIFAAAFAQAQALAVVAAVVFVFLSLLL